MKMRGTEREHPITTKNKFEIYIGAFTSEFVFQEIDHDLGTMVIHSSTSNFKNGWNTWKIQGL